MIIDSQIGSTVRLEVATPHALDGQEGSCYKLNSSAKAIPISSATDIPHGIVIDINQTTDAAGDIVYIGTRIAGVPFGSQSGPVYVRLGAAVTDLSKDLQLRSDGTVEPVSGGSATVVGRPYQTGSAGDLILSLILPTGVGGGGGGGGAAWGDITGTLSAQTDLQTALDAKGTVVATGTAALGTTAISSGALATAVSVSATGVLTTDTIEWTPNADISGVTGYAPVTGGGLIIYPYPTADHVNFKVGNPTSSSVTPGAVTLNWVVIR